MVADSIKMANIVHYFLHQFTDELSANTRLSLFATPHVPKGW